MLIHVKKVLDAEQLNFFRTRLGSANWIDGRTTTGHQSAKVKDNLQLAQTDPLAIELGAIVADAVRNHPTFFSAALPRTILPPMFNCYRGGGTFGNHVDNAVRYNPLTDPPEPLRADVSSTLFLTEPDSYEGGELIVEDTFGTHNVKLAAGDLVLYPSSSLHRVEPVTRGTRIASFFWTQSMIRDVGQRQLLFDLDQAIQRLAVDVDTNHPGLLKLVANYHNLLRRWALV